MNTRNRQHELHLLTGGMAAPFGKLVRNILARTETIDRAAKAIGVSRASLYRLLSDNEVSAAVGRKILNTHRAMRQAGAETRA